MEYPLLTFVAIDLVFIICYTTVIYQYNDNIVIVCLINIIHDDTLISYLRNQVDTDANALLDITHILIIY